MIEFNESDENMLRKIEEKFVIEQELSGQLVPIEDLLKVQFNQKLTNEYINSISSEHQKIYSDYAVFRSETHALIAELNDCIIEQRNAIWFWRMTSSILAAAFFAASVLI
jgi:hypothetical protein